MKHKLLTIAALFATMVALTGAASAVSQELLRDGQVLGEPILVKNHDAFNIGVRLTSILSTELNTNYPLAIQFTNCQPAANCNAADVNFTTLKDTFLVTSTPTSTQDDSARIEVNAPISRQAGTIYQYFVSYLNPNLPSQASRTIVLQGGIITGKKCNDLDGSGICGQGEPGLAGWTINLRDENGTVVATTLTDQNGNYSFKGEQVNITDSTGAVIGTDFLGFRGTFTVEEVLQAGWTQTGPQPVPPGTHTVTVDTNDATGLNFANIQNGSISGQKWNDLNGDAIKDANEPRLSGWTITLTKPDGSTETTQTGTNGNYSFTNLLPGTYTVSETLQAGWKQTAPTPVPPGTYTVNLAGGQNVVDRDFGNQLIPNGSISGQKWNDTNGDGIKGATEPRLANWTITLTKPDGSTETTQTDANGDYSFKDLPPGTYTVSETLQAGWIQTFPAVPGTHTVTLSAGQIVTGIDFGNKKPEELKPGKVVGWGTLGNKVAPELTFKIWAYSNFMPKGTVEAEDDAGNKIKATQIDSVLTDKTVNPMTGEIKGKAMFNNEGPYDFVVMVTDGGEPASPYASKDTFDISIPAKNYHKSGTPTSGDLQVIK
ncbi:MAG: hypothetical protein FIB08_08775 [Candidatus Methanoperedens sp.]|nr:hypothetical protein [Candidatus Methanoperedens sp.]